MISQEIRNKAQDYRDFYQKELLDNVVPFWMKSDLIDPVYGGYITSVDRQGESYNEDKSVWFQGRCLWVFSALCRKYGARQEWKDAADAGIQFLERYCTDSDGRMFFQVTRDGRPLRKRRYLFSESFYVLGMAEYGCAFADSQAVEKAEACFHLMWSIYAHPESDPYKITPKSFSQTRSERSASVLMVLLCCAQTLRRCRPDKAEYYSEVSATIADTMIRFHMSPEFRCVLETVASDGSFIDNPSGRTINPGHACENAWFLLNDTLVSENQELRKSALTILLWSLEKGWDKEYGGILYFADAKNRPCEQLEWDMKLWWVHNEALIATLMAYNITHDPVYWEWFERIHDYAFSHFADLENGEWYGYLHRDGTVSHTQKGSMWKGPFHLPRCLMICEEVLGRIANEELMNPVL